MTISEAFLSSAAWAANRAFARDSRVIAVTLLQSDSLYDAPNSRFATISYCVTVFQEYDFSQQVPTAELRKIQAYGWVDSRRLRLGRVNTTGSEQAQTAR